MAKRNLFQRIFNLADDGQQQDMRVVHVREAAQGTSGTKIYSGYIDEEYLARMKGTQRADEFDKMRRSDSDVVMLLAAVRNLILSAVWEIEPGDESEQAKADAELVKHILMCDMENTWDQFLTEALTCMIFGHSVFERTHKMVQAHPKFGSYVGLQNLAWRNPRTIERWNLDPETKKLSSVTQVAHGDVQKYIDMDARYLTIISLMREGQNYEGISMLRGVYGSYMRKNTYMKLNAIGIEKFAIPTPVAEIPDIDINSEQYTNMIDVLENFVGHESQYITHPVGWKITLVNNTYDPEKVERSVEAEGGRMAKAFLANFLNLGSGGGGSYALSNDLSDFFMSGLDFLANLIVADLNRVVIPELIQINFGSRQVYPKVIHSGISDKAGKELAETLTQLYNGKFVQPDDELEKFLRQKYKLPKASEQGRRDFQDAQQSPGSPFKFSDDSVINTPGGSIKNPFYDNPLYQRIKLAEQKRKP